MLSPFYSVKASDVSWLNYAIMEMNNMVDDYMPKSWGFFRSFRTPSIFTEYTKYYCAYEPRLCNFFSKSMDCTDPQFSDPERRKVFFAMYPGASPYKNW